MDFFTASMYLTEDRVRGMCDVKAPSAFSSHIPLHRSYLGNLCRNGADRGFFTTSSPRSPSRPCRTRCASSCLENGVIDLTSAASIGHQVPELVSQRHRWLNNLFFATMHSVVKFYYIYRSSHSIMRKLWIHVELLYQTFNLIFSWFALVRFPT
jgi:chitin synthase